MPQIDEHCHIGEPNPVYTTRGHLSGYDVSVSHQGLHKARTIRARDTSTLLFHARTQIAQWKEQWDVQNAKQRKATERDHRSQAISQSREAKKSHAEAQKLLAETMTEEAQAELNALRTVLSAALARPERLSWGAIQPRRRFEVPRPRKGAAPQRPLAIAFPPEPAPTPARAQPREAAFSPVIGFLDRLWKPRRIARVADAAARYQQALSRWKLDEAAAHAEDTKRLAQWTQACLDAQRRADDASMSHENQLQALERSYQADVAGWVEQQAQFDAALRSEIEAFADLQMRYVAKETDAVVEFSEMILAASEYPSSCPREFDVAYDGEAQLLIVDYNLPAPEALPRLAEVTYKTSTDSFTEKHVTDAKAGDLYDDLLYQITLRTIHELFSADTASVLQSIIFNGYVTALDKGTGTEVTACILSLHAPRDRFSAIALDKVDSKACFRQLKGVGSSKLHGIAAVAPIMSISRDDRRFVPSHEVVSHLEEGDNLASMEWEEFEHLIREIFSREFSTGGGEVRVTQASRDGGVDAIAFDPDPIRGGKIVIQAKRYTNVVSVSAVRDLYGTVMNEGATKGILVTTANYGSDSYDFAKGKPLTLLNGANLLHLLSKHGVKARIDVNEARQAAGRSPHRATIVE
jgi:restriction system protein